MQALAVDRALVSVTGPDAETYLQGQLSQDLSLSAGSTLLLEPTGKLVALLRFVRVADGFRLDTDAEVAAAVDARLRRFLLRSKVDIEVTRAPVLRVFDGPPLPQAVAVPAWSGPPAPQDVLVPDGDTEAERVAIGAEPLAVEAYHRRRIEAGVPICGVDVGADTIPAEIGRWAIEAAVSFTKGCYTGQELVARIDSRGGNVPKPLRVLHLDGPVEAGSEVLDGGGGPVGHVTSAAETVALAPLARRVEPGAAVTVAGVAGVLAR